MTLKTIFSYQSKLYQASLEDSVVTVTDLKIARDIAEIVFNHFPDTYARVNYFNEAGAIIDSEVSIGLYESYSEISDVNVQWASLYALSQHPLLDEVSA